MTKRATHLGELRELARLHGVQLSYRSKLTRAQEAARPETLLALVRALGAPVHGPHDVPDALRARRRELAERVVDPVRVAWNGEPVTVELRLPGGGAGGRARCLLMQETGETVRWHADLRRSPAPAAPGTDGRRRVATSIPLPRMPLGAHALTIEVGGRTHEVTVLAAPERTGGREIASSARRWGLFLPLHALRTARTVGSGDFTDLQHLARWAARKGASGVATLPLLAQFLDEPCEPSPYLPVSRRFWNEAFLDFTRLPEFERCREARRLASSAAFRRESRELSETPFVDHRRVMALRRRILESLARFVTGSTDAGGGALRAHASARPELVDYARFRAVHERERRGFREWTRRPRNGEVAAGDYDENVFQYHLYVQWRSETQIAEVARDAKRDGCSLYLDFPLGVHPDGYDVWREREEFAHDVSAGAPPDGYSTRGQDWGFPPLHPERSRARGHRYLAACLRHHLRHAGLLRIDHVMSLHRLFWIPHGLDAAHGAYVRHSAEELYAVVCLESHRHGTEIVGEDIGTVAADVRPTMARHGMLRTFVLQREVVLKPRTALAGVPPSSVALTSTHDHHPFASFWRGGDVDDREALGMIDAATARRERAARARARRGLADVLARDRWLRGKRREPARVYAAALACLGSSPARIVIANLEDLWGEHRPQNTPGTTRERPNWIRRARLDLESVSASQRVNVLLAGLERARRKEDSR